MENEEWRPNLALVGLELDTGVRIAIEHYSMIVMTFSSWELSSGADARLAGFGSVPHSPYNGLRMKERLEI